MNINPEDDRDTFDITPPLQKSVEQMLNDILKFIKNAKDDYGIKVTKFFYEIWSYYKDRNEDTKIYLLDDNLEGKKMFVRFDYDNENDVNNFDDINDSFNRESKKTIFENSNYMVEKIFLNKNDLDKFFRGLKQYQKENKKEFNCIVIEKDKENKLIFIIRCGNKIVSYKINISDRIWDEIIEKYFICVNIIESDDIFDFNI